VTIEINRLECDSAYVSCLLLSFLTS